MDLPAAQRRKFADWFYQHESEVLGMEDDTALHPSVTQEILRRRDEVLAHPEWLEPVTSAAFDALKLKLADARISQTYSRQ